MTVYIKNSRNLQPTRMNKSNNQRSCADTYCLKKKKILFLGACKNKVENLIQYFLTTLIFKKGNTLGINLTKLRDLRRKS